MEYGLKIGFTGCGGTGKTTTMNGVLDRYNMQLRGKNYVALGSASRKVYTERNLTEEIVYKMSDRDKLNLQHEIFETKINLDHSNPKFIADRTILDHWAYCLAYCSAAMDRELFIKMEAQTKSHLLGTYDMLFYFPFGRFEAPEDGVRSSSQAWQSQIDSIILGHLHRWKVDCHVIPKGFEDDINEFVYGRIVT